MKDKDKQIQLIKEAQEGNISSFEQLCESYLDKIYYIALNRTKDTFFAEEVTQETIIKVYRNIRKFNFKSSFETWLYKVVYNNIINICKKNKKNGIEPMLYEDENNLIDEKELQKMEKFFMDQDIEKKISAAISKIPFEFQFVLILFDKEGKSYKEISDIIGKSIGTVKSRLHRARKILKGIIINEYKELVL